MRSFCEGTGAAPSERRLQFGHVLHYWFWGAYLVAIHSNGISALHLLRARYFGKRRLLPPEEFPDG